MGLEQDLNDQLKEAMRAKDQRTSNVVRMLKTKVMERRTSKGFSGEITDAVVLEVIAAYRKQVQKAISEFGGAAQAAEQIAELEFEVAYCERFLPKSIGEAELSAIVAELIAKSGATEPAHAGKVVGAFMKEHKGKADAADVKRVAEGLLTKK